MESPRAGPQSPSEQQNCAQHANSSPSGGKSSAISDELEMVRRARAAQQQEASGGAGAGGADFGHASSPTDAKTTTSSGGSGKKKLAKPKPPPLAANGDAISPRQANAAAANTTPIKTLNLNTGVAASNDEWSSTSPRVAASDALFVLTSDLELDPSETSVSCEMDQWEPMLDAVRTQSSKFWPDRNLHIPDWWEQIPLVPFREVRELSSTSPQASIISLAILLLTPTPTLPLCVYPSCAPTN